MPKTEVKSSKMSQFQTFAYLKKSIDISAILCCFLQFVGILAKLNLLLFSSPLTSDFLSVVETTQLIPFF